MQDITEPKYLQIMISADKKTVWINTIEGCIFRACRIGELELIK